MSKTFTDAVDDFTNIYSDWIDLHPFLKELLTHNQCPSSHHMPYIHGSISFILEAQEDLGTAMTVLEGALDVLKRRSEILKAAHRDCMTILSPIRRIPAEIIAEIFRHLRDTDTRVSPAYASIRFPIYRQDSISHAFDIRRPPWRSAMMVCRKWFDVGDTACCSLWANMKMDLSQSRLVSVLPRLLSATLRRSRGHPLSFCIDNPHDIGASERASQELCRLLAEHSDRWEKIEVDVHSDREFRWLNSVRGRLTRLRAVHLRCHKSWGLGGLDPTDALRGAPNLQHLSVEDFPAQYTPSLPISDLTSFRYNNLLTDQLPDPTESAYYLKAFEQSSGLSSFEYMTCASLGSIPPTDLGSSPRICKPLVTELVVGDPAFFASASLPSLTLLVMGGAVEGCIPAMLYPPETLPLMHAMLQHSRCPLVSLVIRNVTLDDTLLSILRELPTLQMLTLSLTEWDEDEDDLLEALVVHLGAEVNDAFPFLPALQGLNLELGDRYNNALYSAYLFLDEHFAEMVLSRIARGLLRRVDLDIWSTRGYWPLEASRVQMLQDTPGVSLTLSTGL